MPSPCPGGPGGKRKKTMGTEKRHEGIMRRGGRRLQAAVLALPLLFGGVAAGTAYAHQGGGADQAGASMEQKGQARLDRALASVNATDAQKAQIHAIWDKARPQLRQLRSEQEKVRKE